MMNLFTVDAFTDEPYRGNPAAVCVVPAARPPLDKELMMKIAAEMNLSETAFVQSTNPLDDANLSSTFSLKWFTPVCEVNLCGHATLATAAVLFEVFKNTNDVISFNTLSGELKAIRNKFDNSISLDFPLAQTIIENTKESDEIIKETVGSLNVSECHYSPKTKKLLIRLSDDVTRAQLESLAPDTHSLLEIQQEKVKGVIVTVKSHDGQYDFLSRYFAPWVGINEDPVTGSAHTVLGPYWSKSLGKEVLKARQCSKRGGDITVKVNEGEERVTLTGRACIILKGKLLI
jgi:PhzF family phenazine biosynthesis protein